MIYNASLPRASSVAALSNYQVVDGDIVFAIAGVKKTSHPGYVREEVRCPGVPPNSPVSLVDCLNEYCTRTAGSRSYFAKAKGMPPARLFIANTKPYQAVNPSTLAKWRLVRLCIKDAEAGYVVAADPGQGPLVTDQRDLCQVLRQVVDQVSTLRRRVAISCLISK